MRTRLAATAFLASLAIVAPAPAQEPGVGTAMCTPRADTAEDMAARKLLAEGLTPVGRHKVPNKFDNDWIKKKGTAFGDAIRLLASACDRTAMQELIVPLRNNDYRLGFQRNPKAQELAIAWGIEFWRVHTLNFGSETPLGETTILDAISPCMNDRNPCGMRADARHGKAIQDYRKARGYGGNIQALRPDLIPERPPASAIQWAHAVAGLGPPPTQLSSLGDAPALMLPQNKLQMEIFLALYTMDRNSVPAGLTSNYYTTTGLTDDATIRRMLEARDKGHVNDPMWRRSQTNGVMNGYIYVNAVRTLAVLGDAFGMAEYARLWDSVDWETYVPFAINTDAPLRDKAAKAWAIAFWARHGLGDNEATAAVASTLGRCLASERCGVRNERAGSDRESTALDTWHRAYFDKKPRSFPPQVPARAPSTAIAWAKWQANLTPAPSEIGWDPEIRVAKRGPDGYGEARAARAAKPRAMTLAEKSAFDAAVQRVSVADYAGAAAGFAPLADAGVAQAMRSLALLKKSGAGVAKDEAGALTMMRAAADAGDGEATYFMGEHETINGDPYLAHGWYLVAAEKDVQRANLAVFYSFSRGYGNALSDVHSGRSYLAIAAEGGDPVAAGELGRMIAFESRNGDKAGLEQAVKYLRVAADGGSRLALLTLGDIYAADGFSGLYDLDQAAQAYTILGDQNKLDMVKRKGARDVTNAEIVRIADERRERYLAELRNAHAYDKGWASRSFNWKGQPPLAPLARQPSELAQYTAISNHYNQISCNAGWSRC